MQLLTEDAVKALRDASGELKNENYMGGPTLIVGDPQSSPAGRRVEGQQGDGSLPARRDTTIRAVPSNPQGLFLVMEALVL